LNNNNNINNIADSNSNNNNNSNIKIVGTILIPEHNPCRQGRVAANELQQMTKSRILINLKKKKYFSKTGQIK